MTAIDDFFTHYYARRPVNATFTGVHAYDDQLPDWSFDGVEALDDEMKTLGSALASEFPAPASAAAFRNNRDLLDAELARAFLEVQRAENATGHGPRGNPALWTGEAIFSVVSLMIRDFAPVGERVEAAVMRLRRIPAFLGHSERRPERPEARNDDPVLMPWIEKTLRECEGASILLSTGMERWLASAPASAQTVARARACAESARDAFQTLATRLASQPDPQPPTVACGPDLYDLLLTRGHFCTRSRADLLIEAKDRFETARADLAALACSAAGSWPNAQEQIAADHPTRDEYHSVFETTWQACHECAERANVISWPDNWPIRYGSYPPWTADAAPHLYYLHYRSPAPFDAVDVYEYVVPGMPEDPVEADKLLRVWNHSTIKLNHVVHHGAIGHHVQNWYAYNQQRSRIGKVAGVDCANRIGMFLGGTMTEGWACYATDVMEELGFLTPLERVSQQHTRVRMLARAIVDIELHQGTMAFGEAIRLYEEQVGISTAAASAEAVKNSMFPCTAIMYWLGTQGIHDLRGEMQRREAPRFSLRRFHGELLGYGSIPVSLVSRMMTERPVPLPG